MKKLMTYLFLTCKKSTELIEKRNLFGLRWYEKMQLGFHKMMCTACPQYEKQSVLIDRIMEKQDYDLKQIKFLDKQFKEQIKEKISNS